MVTTNEPTDSAQSRTLINVTDSDSPWDLTRNQCPAVLHDNGSGGTTQVNLPTDAVGGEEVTAIARSGNNFQLNPGSGNSIIADNGTSYTTYSTGNSVQGSTAGEVITLVALGDGNWMATQQFQMSGNASHFSNSV